MALTHQLIQTITVGAGTASTIDFTSIPQTYTDLKFVLTSRDTNGGNDLNHYFRVNGLATSIYTRKRTYGNGAGMGTSIETFNVAYHAIVNGAGALANAFTTTEIYFPNYTNSNNKTCNSLSCQEQNITVSYAVFTAHTIATASAITSVTFYPVSAFAQYSSVSLYGILRA